LLIRSSLHSHLLFQLFTNETEVVAEKRRLRRFPHDHA